MFLLCLIIPTILEHKDIKNRNDLDVIFSKHKPDPVMHLAAESHVDRSIDAPSDFIETNVIGTFNLLELRDPIGKLLDSRKIFASIT